MQNESLVSIRRMSKGHLCPKFFSLVIRGVGKKRAASSIPFLTREKSYAFTSLAAAGEPEAVRRGGIGNAILVKTYS